MLGPVDGTKPKLVVIVASTREGRFGPVVAEWFAARAEEHDGMDVDLLDLAEAKLPPELSAVPPAEVSAVTKRLEAADAFVVVTPEYNHSFPAPVKTLIDWHFRQWQAKPVGFVSYGGLSGGLRAVEHLRQVFVELHAVTVRDTVSFHGARRMFDEAGQPVDPDATVAARLLLDRLLWWAATLRAGRTATPYVA